MKIVMGIMLLLLVTSTVVVLASPIPVIAQMSSSTAVYLDPPTINGTEIGVNNTVTVNINISNVNDLYGWQAGMTFDPDVLNCTGYYAGEFLDRGGTTYWIDPTSPWNNTTGIVIAHGCVLLGAIPGVNGSGQLGYLTFEVIGNGVSELHLTDVLLCNSEVELIQHEVVDIFTVYWGGIDYSVETISNLTGIDSPPEPSAGLFNHTFSREEKTITFDVITEYDNFFNVTIPAELLGGDLEVLIDEIPINYSITKNATHASLYFTHSHSTHNIKIEGTTAIPEFPAAIILPLFMILSLITVVFVKLKKKKQ